MSIPNAWVYFEEHCYLATVIAAVLLHEQIIARLTKVDVLPSKVCRVQITRLMGTIVVMALQHWGD